MKVFEKLLRNRAQRCGVDSRQLLRVVARGLGPLFSPLFSTSRLLSLRLMWILCSTHLAFWYFRPPILLKRHGFRAQFFSFASEIVFPERYLRFWLHESDSVYLTRSPEESVESVPISFSFCDSGIAVAEVLTSLAQSWLC